MQNHRLLSGLIVAMAFLSVLLSIPLVAAQGILEPRNTRDVTATSAPAPVAYYPLDGDLSDHSGNGRHGNEYGDITFQPGISGQAAEFDGDDWMWTEENPLLRLADEPRTLCLWGKSADGVKDGNADHLANWGTAIDGQAFGVMIFNGNTWWGYGHGWTLYDTDTGVIADTAWHFLCVTYDSTRMRVYLDGVQRGERDMSLNTVASMFYIGVRPDQSLDNTFDGLIDEVTIYDRMLTAEEIQELQAYTLSISGQVVDESGSGISGVAISVTGGASAITDETGAYTVTGLMAGTYTITPSKSGLTFSPQTRVVSVPPYVTGQDFIGFPPPGTGVLEVTVSLQGRTDHSGVTSTAWLGGQATGSCLSNLEGICSTEVPSETYSVTLEMPSYLDSVWEGVSVSAGMTTALPAVELRGGDVNDDCEVDILDLSRMGSRFGTQCGDPDWDPASDINADCVLNILDLTIAGGNFYRSCPTL